jgi:hypothetical protein
VSAEQLLVDLLSSKVVERVAYSVEADPEQGGPPPAILIVQFTDGSMLSAMVSGGRLSIELAPAPT